MLMMTRCDSGNAIIIQLGPELDFGFPPIRELPLHIYEEELHGHWFILDHKVDLSLCLILPERTTSLSMIQGDFFNHPVYGQMCGNYASRFLVKTC